MLNEVIKISSPNKGGTFLDCTFGGGGYSQEILKFQRTKVIGIDRDKAVKSIAEKLRKKFSNRSEFHNLKFSNIDKVLKDNVDNIIFDLGLSSIQLNNLKRGFSFKSKVNFRYVDGSSHFSAQEVVNSLAEKELGIIIKTFGEERDANVIAKNIVKARSEKKITKVDELVNIIEKSKKKFFPKK